MTLTARNQNIKIGDWIEGWCVTTNGRRVGPVVAVPNSDSGPDAEIRGGRGRDIPVHYSRHVPAPFAVGDRVAFFSPAERHQGIYGTITHAARFPGGGQNVEAEFDDGSGYHGDSGGVVHADSAQ